MKLTKYKVGILSISVLLILAVLAGFSTGLMAKEISKSDFHQMTGNYLSKVDLNGDGTPDFSRGSTLELDFDSITQTQSLVIDLEEITVKPSDTISSSTVTIKQGSPWGGANTGDIKLNNNVDASIVILKNGAQLDSLRFEPSQNSKPANAIEVDFFQTSNSTREMKFHNLEMPISGSNGSFTNGIKFDGSVAGIIGVGAGGTDYINNKIVFDDFRVDGNNGGGISGKGILFTSEVEEVANLTFNKLYVGDTKYGIYFDNKGTVKNIEIANSERLAPSVSELEYAITNNGDGIRINGANVTKVSDFTINYVRIEDNGDNGIYIKGDNTPNNNPDPISSIDMSISNALISGNGSYGILIGTNSGNYSPAKLDKVTLGNNLKVYNNASGGARFLVKKVVGSQSSPGLIVKNSRFNEETTGDGYNNQAFGLKVNAYEGIDGAKISNSTFNDHNSGPGLKLAAPNTDPWYDSVEGVTITGTSANNNGTSDHPANGLKIAANLVRNVEIKNADSGGGSFVDNMRNGIYVYGKEGISDVTIKDSDGDYSDNDRNVKLDSNAQSGLVVRSEKYIKGLDVIGVDLNHNKNGNGARVYTTGSGDIGAEAKLSDGISFSHIRANYNEKNGVLVSAAGDFQVNEENVFVDESEFKENKGDGLSLKANGNVKYSRIRNSVFVGNNVSSEGIYIEAGEKLSGAANKVEINNNKVAGNKKGIHLYASSISNVRIQGNSTSYSEDGSSWKGNEEHSVYLSGPGANTISSVSVLGNVFTGDTETMLEIKANGKSSDLAIKENMFRSSVLGACAGSGTGIVLDATDALVENNEFEALSTALLVKQEDTTNPHRINKNNFLPCCTTIDARALDDDLGSGQKLDATNNYWGKDKSKSYIETSIEGLEYVDYTPTRDNPVVVVQWLEISNFNVATSNPQVGETVKLKFTLKNVSDQTISGQNVKLIIKDKSGNVVIETFKDDVPKTQPGGTHSVSHTFVPTKAEQYTATLEVDNGAVTDSIPIQVTGGVTPPTENLNPDWANTGLMPAPIDGSSTPHLVIQNKDKKSLAGDVSSVTINVYDLSGRKLVTLNSVNGLNKLSDLQNGLYIYTVTVTTPDVTKAQSPVMKFVVKN